MTLKQFHSIKSYPDDGTFHGTSQVKLWHARQTIKGDKNSTQFKVIIIKTNVIFK